MPLVRVPLPPHWRVIGNGNVQAHSLAVRIDHSDQRAASATITSLPADGVLASHRLEVDTAEERAAAEQAMLEQPLGNA
jgi:hypothetical protein